MNPNMQPPTSTPTYPPASNPPQTPTPTPNPTQPIVSSPAQPLLTTTALKKQEAESTLKRNIIKAILIIVLIVSVIIAAIYGFKYITAKLSEGNYIITEVTQQYTGEKPIPISIAEMRRRANKIGYEDYELITDSMAAGRIFVKPNNPEHFSKNSYDYSSIIMYQYYASRKDLRDSLENLYDYFISEISETNPDFEDSSIANVFYSPEIDWSSDYNKITTISKNNNLRSVTIIVDNVVLTISSIDDNEIDSVLSALGF